MSVMVVLARSPGCLSRHQPPARSQGFPILAYNFPSEPARARDSVEKSPAWRGLDAASLFHFGPRDPRGRCKSRERRRLAFCNLVDHGPALNLSRRRPAFEVWLGSCSGQSPHVTVGRRPCAAPAVPAPGWRRGHALVLVTAGVDAIRFKVSDSAC